MKNSSSIVLGLFTLLFARQGLSQQIDVTFERVVHDFGMIAENGGYVGFNFLYINNSDFAIEIDSAIVSCGCVVPQWPEHPIAPGDTGEVAIVYDPLGRPGQFTKSLAVFFKGGDTTATRYLNVKGRVLPVDLVDQAMDHYETYDNVVYDFQIKPATFVFNGKDPMDDNSSAFNQFMNDITYVIDQDGFVNITIHLEIYEDNSAALLASENILEVIRLFAINKVQTALERRQYPEVAVGITYVDTIIERSPASCNGCTGLIRFSSDHYNNDFIKESLILPITDVAVMKDTSVTFADSVFTAPGSLGYWHVTGNAEKFKYKSHRDDYAQFLRSLVLIYLDLGEVDIQLKVGSRSDDVNYFDDVNAMKVIQADLLGELFEDLIEEGVDTSRVYIRDHHPVMAGLEDDEAWEFVQFAMYYHEDPADQNTVEFVPEPVNRKDPVVELPHENMPVYQLSFSGEGNKHIDTSSTEFITMMDSVFAMIAAGNKVNLLIESSASKTPTGEEYGNEYVSRLRAKETEETITAYMLAHGINDSDIHFADHVCLVQGPEFRRDIYPISFYKQFQFLRVIPYIEPESDAAVDGLVPYMINFGEAKTQINTFSPIFEQFVGSLIPMIKEQGYIKIILEASSSRIPATSYRTNDILSFYRAQDGKDILLHALNEAGVDPLRVIITEQNALVQGPEYNEHVDPDKTPYEKYQYIKIIPEALLK